MSNSVRQGAFLDQVCASTRNTVACQEGSQRILSAPNQWHTAGRFWVCFGSGPFSVDMFSMWVWVPGLFWIIGDLADVYDATVSSAMNWRPDVSWDRLWTRYELIVDDENKAGQLFWSLLWAMRTCGGRNKTVRWKTRQNVWISFIGQICVHTEEFNPSSALSRLHRKNTVGQRQ